MREATGAQHGIWFTERAGVAGTAYHMALAIWFDGELDTAALSRACDAVVRRHEPLRSALAERDGALWLVPAPVPPVVRQVGYRPDLVRDEVTRGFDLERGPLARFTLAEESAQRHLLLFTAHHLVFDGMSKDILVRELAAGYAGLPEPAPLPVTYAEYATAERERVAAEVAGAREFWRERFTEPAGPRGLGLPAALALPGLRRIPLAAEPGAVHEFTVDEPLSGDLDRTARALGVTRFELLLSAVHLLLRRYGNRRAPVAVDMSTRTGPVEDHIGLFVNELPVAAGPGGAGPASAGPGGAGPAGAPPAGVETFRQLAGAVRSELREVYRYRGVPISYAAGALRPRAAICPVSLSYRRRAVEEAKFPGLDATVDWLVFHHTARNALHVQLVDSLTRIDVGLQYAPAAFDSGAVERIGAQLLAVLGAVVADPDLAVADPEVALADPAVAAAGPVRSYPPELTVAGGFAAQARATPAAVAVVCGPRRLTYRQLDGAVAGLAGELLRRGVGAGDLVALCLPRSVEALVAPLAVGRAGAAYLPLDPNHPPGRWRLILAEAAPKLVVTTDAQREELAGAAPVITVDRLPVSGEAPPPPDVDPAGVAYVIYTSGSTGRPKGVAVPHRAVVNLLLSMRDALGCGPGDAWLGQAALAFDMSVPELFLPLLTGGATVVVPEELVRDGAGQLGLIRAEGVTHMQATPSGWRMLLDSGFGGGREHGIVALAGAEALPDALARELRPRVRRLFNVYGPTETTVWSTMAELPDPFDQVTIGTPIAGTELHLLDERLSPVPTGAPGELYIGGAGLADGYLGQPELTAQRFVRYGDQRLYRTGDLCRQLPDGRFVYLGRIDEQVKLRGHRIELGEIEAALLDVPGVRQAAAALRDDRLIAYLVGEPPPERAMRERLATVLPAVMIPTAWLVLDRLPLTPNGKLDRAALPDPPAARSSAPTPVDVPTDPVTEQVRAIWQDTLQIHHVDLDDDLFDLGGHSLTVTRIIGRIHRQLGVSVPLGVFYDTPTLAEVVAVIRELVEARPR